MRETLSRSITCKCLHKALSGWRVVVSHLLSYLLFLCALQRPTSDTEPDFLESDLLPGNETNEHKMRDEKERVHNMIHPIIHRYIAAWPILFYSFFLFLFFFFVFLPFFQFDLSYCPLTSRYVAERGGVIGRSDE